MRNLESRTAGCLTKSIKDLVKRAERTVRVKWENLVPF